MALVNVTPKNRFSRRIAIMETHGPFQVSPFYADHLLRRRQSKKKSNVKKQQSYRILFSTDRKYLMNSFRIIHSTIQWEKVYNNSMIVYKLSCHLDSHTAIPFHSQYITRRPPNQNSISQFCWWQYRAIYTILRYLRHCQHFYSFGIRLWGHLIFAARTESRDSVNHVQREMKEKERRSTCNPKREKGETSM